MADRFTNFERMSALQKCIRRSMTDEAGYWFFAMCEDGFGTMAFNRLNIICHEDIGWRDMMTALYVDKCCRDGVEWYKAKNSAWQLAGANAILAMTNAGKCREADNFQAACLGELRDNPDRQIPDFAYDKHTLKGKRMGRGFEHFFKEGALLVNPDGKEVPHDSWWDRAVHYFTAGYFDKKQEQPIDNKTLF